MCRLAVTVAFAALLAGGDAAEAQTCDRGSGQCAVDADHVLLATKLQLSTKQLSAEQVRVSKDVFPSMPVSVPGVNGESPIPPVSTTMKCVISVTLLYFFVWTSLFVVSSVQDYTGNKYALHEILAGACDTVEYAPMISVLFIVTRMRAIACTKGETELYGLPQWWCKDGMVVSASCVAALTAISMLEKAVQSEGLLVILSALQYMADAALYAGFSTVIAGLYLMDSPPRVGTSIPISDTAKCIMNLTIFYFLVAILHQIGNSIDMYKAKRDSKEQTEHGTFTRTMHASLKAMDLAAMVCVLFLGARMRALQLGHSDPQQWARIFFFAATYGILTYSIAVGIGEVLPSAESALSVVEALALATLHVSTAVAIYSIFTIEAKVGPTPFISTTVRVVMGLTVCFFFVHSCLFFSEKLYENQILKTNFAVEMFKSALDSIMFCPMLCALFVGTRMRALQLSHNLGAPQGWAQDCMMLATYAIFIDLVTVLVEHAFGNPEEKHAASRTLQAVCIAVLHASSTAVMVSLFLQTRENTMTNGGGELIPGFKIPGRA